MGSVKKMTLMVAVLFAVASFASVVYAQTPFATNVELTDRINFGVKASAVIPEKSQYADTGFNVQGMLTYDILQWLAIGGEIGYTTIDMGWSGTVSGTSLDLDFGTLHAMPFLGTVTVKAPLEFENYSLVPYIVNGFGGVYSKFDESSLLSNAGISVKTDTSFLYKLGAGFNFYVIDMVALNFETSYQWADIGTTATDGTDTWSGDVNANALYIGGGLTVRF